MYHSFVFNLSYPARIYSILAIVSLGGIHAPVLYIENENTNDVLLLFRVKSPKNGRNK